MTLHERGAITFDMLHTALVKADMTLYGGSMGRFVGLIDEWMAEYDADETRNSNSDGDRMIATVFRIVRDHLTKE